jgi:NAD(P)-dependent dehydrogenase (short-subunit alcohol dehydrogenase family)
VIVSPTRSHKRTFTPEEMAKTAAFLASDDASFVSGHGPLTDARYSIA